MVRVGWSTGGPMNTDPKGQLSKEPGELLDRKIARAYRSLAAAELVPEAANKDAVARLRVQLNRWLAARSQTEKLE